MKFQLIVTVLAVLAIFASAGLTNLGRSVNVLSGFQGVTPGGTASINLPVNQRYFRNVLQCYGIYYSAPTLTLTGAGSVNATFTFTIGAAGSATPGSITAIAYGGTNSGMTNGTYTSTLTGGKQAVISDITGFGATCTVTIAGGSVTGIVVNNGGTQCPIDPRILLTSCKQIVNGQVVRDASPTSVIGAINHSGYVPQYGSFPLLYADPQRNWLRDAEMNSWDMNGQGSFQLQFGISAAVGSPALGGVMEFDPRQNTRTINANNQKYILQANGQTYPIGTKVPYLSPIAQHQTTVTITSGRFDITTIIPTYPISRIYLAGATPGNIYGLDIVADGAIRLQTTLKDLAELNSEYGFETSSPVYAPNSNGNGFGGLTNPTGTPIPTWALVGTPATIPNGVLGANSGTATQPYAWDAVYIADMNGRPWNALRCANLIIRTYANAGENVTVMVESLPGAYRG